VHPKDTGDEDSAVMERCVATRDRIVIRHGSLNWKLLAELQWLQL